MLTDFPHEVTVRKQTYGGDISPEAIEYPAGQLSQRREMVLLIHGFNVDACDAGCSYDLFLENADPPLRNRAVQVYWPGDVVSRFIRAGQRPGLWSKVVSAIHYPSQRQHAVQTAQLLSDIISSSLNGRPNVRLSIVAHSLGCRVALELLVLLSALKNTKQISIPLAILMAPAVPRYLVLPGGHLKTALRIPDRILLYRSLNDSVLQFVFRPGQALERPFPEGWPLSTRTALGRHGMGLTRPPNVTEIEATCGHGGYWPDPDIAYEAGRIVFGASRTLLRRDSVSKVSSYTNQRIGRQLLGRTLKERSLLSRVRKPCDACKPA